MITMISSFYFLSSFWSPENRTEPCDTQDLLNMKNVLMKFFIFFHVKPRKIMYIAKPTNFSIAFRLRTFAEIDLFSAILII